MKRIGTAAAVGTVLAVAAPAQAQNAHATISPYIEVSQVLTSDTGDRSDVLTYSQVSAGVDGHIATRRIEAEISYRFDERIDWQKHTQVDQVHSGMARVAAKITPFLSIEAGGLATRASTDIRGATASNFAGSGQNLSQIYSGYVGPTLTKQAGAFGLAASYRYGVTYVDTPDSTGVPTGSLPIDGYGHSHSQLAQASVGTKAGTILPVGLSVSGAWEKENASQLDQRYIGKYARGDVVAPVSGTVALLAGLGYEDIRITQKDALLDSAGLPVVDSRGRFVTNQASPNRIAYDTTGLFWDAGVLWRPSPRTSVQGRVGRRYGTMSYTGAISHQTGSGSGFQIGVYDSVETFGQQLNNGVAAMPTSFSSNNGGIGTGYAGCTFSSSTGSAGGCLNGALQSATSSAYRARGVDAVAVLVRGQNSFGLGAGYANRRYSAPTDGTVYSVDGLVDQSYYAQLMYARQLSRTATFNASLYANYANPGAVGAEDVITAGGVATLSQRFGRINAFGSLGAYLVDQKGEETDVSGQAQVGMRYQF